MAVGTLMMQTKMSAMARFTMKALPTVRRLCAKQNFSIKQNSKPNGSENSDSFEELNYARKLIFGNFLCSMYPLQTKKSQI